MYVIIRKWFLNSVLFGEFENVHFDLNEEILHYSDKILPVLKATQTHTFNPITSLHRIRDYGCQMKPLFIEIQNFLAWTDILGR